MRAGALSGRFSRGRNDPRAVALPDGAAFRLSRGSGAHDLWKKMDTAMTDTTFALLYIVMALGLGTGFVAEVRKALA